MYKIAVIENIHKDGIDLLKKHPNFDYELIEDVSEKNLLEKLPKFDACTLRVSRLDEKILKHCPKLKAISRHGVGYDNVDIRFLKEKKISLLVIDEGKGFKEKDTNKIFKRFYSNRPDKFGQHSGLGLNIVKNLVDLHDATIIASNNKGKVGATVEITFPPA